MCVLAQSRARTRVKSARRGSPGRPAVDLGKDDLARIEWLARAIHPWDRDLPADKAERLFSQQCLDDANAAITRLFAEIPVLDTIEVRVRRDIAHSPILLGTVCRDSLRTCEYSSIGMRLRAIGLSFRMNNLCLEEIETS
jgi:hypothetical protein